MAKYPNLARLSSQYNTMSVLNENFDKIEEALANTISLDGSTPNAMESDLDLDNNDLLNVNKLYVNDFEVQGETLDAFVRKLALSDLEEDFAALVSDTNNTAVKLAQNEQPTIEYNEAQGGFIFGIPEGPTGPQGANGVGGDLFSNNNLSELTDADTALDNLGLTILGKSIAKAVDANTVKNELGFTDFGKDTVAETNSQSFKERLGLVVNENVIVDKVDYSTGSTNYQRVVSYNIPETVNDSKLFVRIDSYLLATGGRDDDAGVGLIFDCIDDSNNTLTNDQGQLLTAGGLYIKTASGAGNGLLYLPASLHLPILSNSNKIDLTPFGISSLGWRVSVQIRENYGATAITRDRLIHYKEVAND